MSSFQTHLRALSISRLDDLTTLDDPTFDTRHLVDVAAAAAAAAAPPPLPRRLKASNRVSSKQALVTRGPVGALTRNPMVQCGFKFAAKAPFGFISASQTDTFVLVLWQVYIAV